jgi:hypothetical protein
MEEDRMNFNPGSRRVNYAQIKLVFATTWKWGNV